MINVMAQTFRPKCNEKKKNRSPPWNPIPSMEGKKKREFIAR